MSNEILWIIVLIINFLIIIGVYRYLGKVGILSLIPLFIIVANIQVAIGVVLFNIDATLGNIAYASTFLISDILSENYGKKIAQKSVVIGFMSLILFTGIMHITLYFTPAEYSEALTAYEHILGIFQFFPRIVLAGLIAYVVSQTHDIWAYHFWKQRFSAVQFLWLRNNASTLVSQLLDTVIFALIAFWGTDYPLVGIIISTYIIKGLVAVVDTIFLYWARYLYDTHHAL